MRVFEVFNPKRAAHAAWILAPDKTRAIELGHKCLSSKTLDALDVSLEFSALEPGIASLMNDPNAPAGRLFKVLRSGFMTGDEFIGWIAGKPAAPKPRDTWEIHPL